MVAAEEDNYCTAKYYAAAALQVYVILSVSPLMTACSPPGKLPVAQRTPVPEAVSPLVLEPDTTAMPLIVAVPLIVKSTVAVFVLDCAVLAAGAHAGRVAFEYALE